MERQGLIHMPLPISGYLWRNDCLICRRDSSASLIPVSTGSSSNLSLSSIMGGRNFFLYSSKVNVSFSFSLVFFMIFLHRLNRRSSVIISKELRILFGIEIMLSINPNKSVSFGYYSNINRATDSLFNHSNTALK